MSKSGLKKMMEPLEQGSEVGGQFWTSVAQLDTLQEYYVARNPWDPWRQQGRPEEWLTGALVSQREQLMLKAWPLG